MRPCTAPGASCARRAPAAVLAARCRLAVAPPLAARPRLASAAAAPSGVRPQHRQRLLARSTSSEDTPHPDQPLAAESPIMEVERQSERALAYTAVTALLGGGGLALAAAPSKSIQFLWGACPGLLVAGMARVLGSILLLAAIVAHCLKEAAEKDLLRSDTYKRLNLALFWWGLGTAAALWLVPQQPLRYALGVCTVLLAGTSAHAALTYHETSEEGEGWSPLYLTKQFLRSLGNLTSYANGKESAIYSLYAYGFAAKATIAAVTAAVLHRQLRLAVDGVLLAPLGVLGESLVPVNGVGYALGAVVLFTLKDAAARGRLGASTFRALNIGVAVMALANGITIASWLQAGVVAQSKSVLVKLASHALLAGIALYNYAFAQKKKH